MLTRTLEAAFEMGCGIDNLMSRDELVAELRAALAAGDAQALADELMAFSVWTGSMLQEVQRELGALESGMETDDGADGSMH